MPSDFSLETRRLATTPGAISSASAGGYDLTQSGLSLSATEKGNALGNLGLYPRLASGADVVAIGDSITIRNEGLVGTNLAFCDSYMTAAMVALNGAINFVSNKGIGGNTSVQMLARFSTDVVALAPKIVAILAGTNDTTPATETLPNIEAMINLSLPAGILPVLATIPPAGMAALTAPVPTATASTTGGTLAAGTYSYRVSATNVLGETLASTAATATTTGSTGSVSVAWPSVRGATGYKVYGRVSGSELLISTITSSGVTRPTCGFLDTGAATPSGALPGGNTTASGSLTTPTRAKIAGVNGIVHYLAQKYGLPLVDFYALCTDPATGMWRTGWSIDGTHPEPWASKAMGVEWARVVAPWLVPNSPYLAYDNSDPTVLYTNPLFLSNDGTKPTGWSPSNGVAAESITTDAAVAGSVYRTNRLDYTARFDGGPSGNVAVTAGRTLEIAFKVKVVGADANGGQFVLGLKNQLSQQLANFYFNSDTPSSGWATVRFKYTVPAGTTAFFFYKNSAYGPVDASIGQLTVRDLTAAGLA